MTSLMFSEHFRMNKSGRSHHHRKNSSVISLNASSSKNSEKIERLQAFDKWKLEKTIPSFSSKVNSVNVHFSHRNAGNYVLECTGPDGHWMVEKSLPDFAEFQKELKLAFPVEAGQTGKPKILPKLKFLKCPHWLLLNREIGCWYRNQIGQFMRSLLKCSLLVSKSRLVEEFLDSNHLTFEEEQEELSGMKLRISAPISSKNVLRCTLGHVDLKQDEKITSIITVVYKDNVYPLVNLKSFDELCQSFPFINEMKQFYVKSETGKMIINDENFERISGLNNQLLYLDILH